MYHHHIQGMASSLVKAGLITDEKQTLVVLSNYWLSKIAVVWCIDDVHSIQKDFDRGTQKSSLSDEQALEILSLAFENHDSGNGITWESLRYWSQEYLEQEILRIEGGEVFQEWLNQSEEADSELEEIDLTMPVEVKPPDFPSVDVVEALSAELRSQVYDNS